jgi:electron transfer flavoprotein alpha subunit
MTGNEIWVIAEVRSGQLTRSSGQLLGAARKLAAEKGFSTAAVLVGGEEAHAVELTQKVPVVLWLKGIGLESYDVVRYLFALGQLLETRGYPVAILAGAGAAGLEFMPRLAVRCGVGYASYCVDAWWEGTELAVRRPVFGGRVYEELALTKEPALLTIRPGAFSIPENLPQPGQVETLTIDLPGDPGLHLVERKSTSTGKKDVSEAVCVVAGGRGMGSPENFKLLEELAVVLDGAVGVSRAVVDSGWRPHDEQVGKSGKTISPGLYFACGISGAIHHILGMNTSKVVVAINKDPGALIFENADYGVVGDVLTFIPALTEALKRMNSK